MNKRIRKKLWKYYSIDDINDCPHRIKNEHNTEMVTGEPIPIYYNEDYCEFHVFDNSSYSGYEGKNHCKCPCKYFCISHKENKYCKKEYKRYKKDNWNLNHNYQKWLKDHKEDLDEYDEYCKRHGQY